MLHKAPFFSSSQFAMIFSGKITINTAPHVLLARTSKIVPLSVCLSRSVKQCDLGLALGWCRSRCQLQRFEKGLWQDQHQGHCVARRGLETSRGHPGKKVRPSDLPWRGPLRYAWPTNNLRSKQGNHLPGALTKSNWGASRLEALDGFACPNVRSWY